MTVKAYIRDNSTRRFGLGQKAIVLFSIFSCLCIPTLLFTDRPSVAFLSHLTGSLGHLATILSTMIPLVVLFIALDRIVGYTRHWRFVFN